MKKEGARLSFDSIFGKKRKKKENPSPFFSLRVLSPPSLTKGKGSLSLSLSLSLFLWCVFLLGNTSKELFQKLEEEKLKAPRRPGPQSGNDSIDDEKKRIPFPRASFTHVW